MDLGEMLAQVDDLDTVVRALAREQVIRQTMARTGEEREHVADFADAMDSMNQEAVLELTDGAPTTLRDALSRYIDEVTGLATVTNQETMKQVQEDLTTILNYPWSAEEDRIAGHGDRVGLSFSNPDGDNPEVRVGGMKIADLEVSDQGRVADVIIAVHRAVLARVIPDRDHIVQISSTDRRSLLAWLERASGVWHTNEPSRLTLDAVEGGGALIRTRPYVWVQLPRTQV